MDGERRGQRPALDREGRAPAPSRGRADSLGRVLVALAGGVGVLCCVPVLMVGCFAWSMAVEAGPDNQALVGCRTSECAQLGYGLALASLAILSAVVVLLWLAARSSARSLLAAVVLSYVAAGTAATVAVRWLAQGTYIEAVAVPLIAAATAATFGLGCALRRIDLGRDARAG